MSSEVVWFVKLPAEWKEIFEEVAKKEGDYTRGAPARQIRKIVKKHLDQEGLD